MSTQSTMFRIRQLALLVWLALIGGVAIGVFSPGRVAGGVGGIVCTKGWLPTGCASIYGVLEDAYCEDPAEDCETCWWDPGSFCFPEEECQVDVCRLDGYRFLNET